MLPESLVDFRQLHLFPVRHQIYQRNTKVGTRIAVPLILPSKAGSTRPMLRAAPVDVGIIDTAAALALRKSSAHLNTLVNSIGMDRSHKGTSMPIFLVKL